MLTTHQTCPAKYQLRSQGWTSRRKSGALGFGGALHAGLAEWYRSGDIGKSLLAINNIWPENLPVDDWRTKEKCVTVMIDYAKEYPTESFKVVGAPDNPVIEVPFTIETGMYLPCGECTFENALPMPGTVRQTIGDEIYNPVCSNGCGTPREAIEYGGIYDLLADFSGQLYVVDHKSTSMLGDTYFNQFKPNNQMTGYIWAASKLSGRRVHGALINAIGIYKVGKTKFKRDITTRSETAINEWLLNVYTECLGIKAHEQGGVWPMRTGSCTMYGLCEYHPVHVLDHEVERAKRLETDFLIEKWDYEMREG